jgi:hypothetical protein
MAQIVTLTLDANSHTPSSALQADMEQDLHSLRSGGVYSDSIGAGLTRSDFRQHVNGTFDGVVFDGYGDIHASEKHYHWMLHSVFGRDVLKSYLAMLKPEVTISKWRVQPELNEELNAIVDRLGLRDLPEPKSFVERIQYVALMSKLTLQAESRNHRYSLT